MIKTLPEIIRERAIQAFHSLREQAKENGLQGMSLDEINEEIRLVQYGDKEKDCEESS